MKAGKTNCREKNKQKQNTEDRIQVILPGPNPATLRHNASVRKLERRLLCRQPGVWASDRNEAKHTTSWSGGFWYYNSNLLSVSACLSVCPPVCVTASLGKPVCGISPLVSRCRLASCYSKMQTPALSCFQTTKTHVLQDAWGKLRSEILADLPALGLR